MTLITWNDAGMRRYEIGCDRGVLYPPTGPGVPWSGLVGVNQKPTGGEPTPYYIDGVKYLNRPSVEEFAATLDAYYYPDEFEQFDGNPEENGMHFDQQTRREFNLCYRTLLGNDLEGTDYGYKIHLLYNILATPSDRNYKTVGAQVEPMVLSWDLSTTPIAVAGRRPTAHFTINSTRIDPELLAVIESYLYGSPNTPARMLTPAQWVRILGFDVFEVTGDTFSGIWPIIEAGELDLLGNPETGLYDVPPLSNLVEATPGFYSMET